MLSLMRWQQALGVVLGFFLVGPVVAGLLLRTRAGAVEFVLAGVVAAAAGYFIAGSVALKAGRGRTR